jgi:hypothetical protein
MSFARRWTRMKEALNLAFLTPQKTFMTGARVRAQDTLHD